MAFKLQSRDRRISPHALHLLLRKFFSFACPWFPVSGLFGFNASTHASARKYSNILASEYLETEM